MRDADLILHVVDLSNPRFEQQMESVNNLLLEIGLDRMPQLAVFNKADLVNPLQVSSKSQRSSLGPCICAGRGSCVPNELPFFRKSFAMFRNVACVKDAQRLCGLRYCAAISLMRECLRGLPPFSSPVLRHLLKMMN